MTSSRKPTSTDLASFVASRICHDLISPIGAIENGFEVLEDDTSQEMQKFALDLIRKSALQASAAVQMARVAYGGALVDEGPGAHHDSDDAHKLCRDYFAHGSAQTVWKLARRQLTRAQLKLLLNIICVAGQITIRGGEITVTDWPETGSAGFKVHASGATSLPAETLAIIKGDSEEELGARTVQPHYCRMLADFVGARLAVSNGQGFVEIAVEY